MVKESDAVLLALRFVWDAFSSRVGWTVVNELVFPILLLAGWLVLWSMLRARPIVQG